MRLFCLRHRCVCNFHLYVLYAVFCFHIFTFLHQLKGDESKKVGRGKKRENEKDNKGDRMNYKWRGKEMNMGLEEYTKGR